MPGQKARTAIVRVPDCRLHGQVIQGTAEVEKAFHQPATKAASLLRGFHAYSHVESVRVHQLDPEAAKPDHPTARFGHHRAQKARLVSSGSVAGTPPARPVPRNKPCHSPLVV